VFAIALTLVARAAIVPSSGRRTFLLGLLATLMATVAYAQRVDAAGSSLAGFAGVWTFAFTAAAALVSRVIYGLQRRVQEAARLGQYILESKLGEGGMGTVYRARHAMLRRPTAIKLLLPSRAGAENVARFEREVQQTARLSHPNTVTIYDYGRTPDGVFYYAMELLDGADLDEVVELDGAQSVARAVHIVSCVAGALSEAHEAGLIHRDIKPANIMLCQQGGVLDVAKVVDFGLVKQLGEAGMTQANTLQGTPLYMAPEAITSPDELDARADLYALGAVTYYLLTGRHVFEGESVLAVCTQHLSATPDPPSAHAKQPIPEGLERLVLQCLEKDPNERPASAAEVQASLLSLDIPVWDARAAKAWWNEHGDALRSKRRAPTEEVKRTVAVDLTARG
jgi:serine/threonine-protein kinase